MSPFDYVVEKIVSGISAFATREIAFLVAFSILGCSLLIWAIFTLLPHLSFTSKLRAATNAVRDAKANAKLSSDDRLAIIDKSLKNNSVMAEAWQPYRLSLRVDPNRKDGRLNPIDPHSWFALDRLPGRGYEKWAATMAGVSLTVGLLFTFIGLTAALFRVGQAGADTEQLRLAIAKILQISSAKFITSMAGIVAYIGWSVVARQYNSAQSKLVARFASAVQTLTAPISPEALLLDQLQEARDQTARMKTQADDMAIAFDRVVGQRFDALPDAVNAILRPALEQSMRPVVEAIQGMGSTIGAGNQAAIGGMLTDLMSGVKDATGQEMNLLASTMREAAAELANAKSGIGSGGAEFGQMLARASEGMTAASSRMVDAMERRMGEIDARMQNLDSTLSSGASRLDTMGSSMSDAMAEGLRRAMESVAAASAAGADAARQHAQAGLAPVLEELASLMSDIRASAEGGRAALVASGEQAAHQLGRALRAAGDELAAASGKASAELASSFQVSTQQMLRSVEESVAGYRTATESLATRLSVVERGFSELEASTRRNVGQMEAVGTSLGDAGRSFGLASDQLRQAASPVLATLEAANTAASGARSALEIVQQTSEAMRTAAEAMEASSEAAVGAFGSYEQRFAGVDASLGQTVGKLRDGIIELGNEVTEVVTKYDEHLARAVGSLKSGVESIADALEGIGSNLDRAD
jgi:hypothetical protein